MKRRELMLIVAAIIGSSVVMLGESIVNLALPSIGRSFGVPFSSLQWVVESYNLTLSALILVGGSLGDSLGLRRVYLWSAAAFLCISLLCTFAWNAPTLIVMRALLGIAGALLTPVALAILNAQLPQEMRGRAIGYWTAWISIMLAGGPLVGGYLVDLFSWRALFLINIPLAALALWLGSISIQDEPTKAGFTMDWTGVLLGFVGLAGITYGLIEGPAQSWSIAQIGALTAGIIFFILFVWWERRPQTTHPILDVNLFRNVNFSATNLATFFLYAGFAGFGLVFAVFLQTVGGYSSALTGAAFIPTSIMLGLFSGKVGAYATKIGPRIFMTAGPLICAAGMLALLRITPGVPYFTGILPGVLLFSLGLTLVVAPLTATALNSSPDEKSGTASAINNGVASVGPLIAIALIGLFNASHTYTGTVIMCAALAALAGGISFAFIRKDPDQNARNAHHA